MLHRLKLINFRNIINQEFFFNDGINLIIGDNAQGKTNICEAIYYLFNLKSFRTRNYLDLFYKSKDILEPTLLEGEIDNDVYRVLIDKKTKSSLNGKVVQKRSLYKEKIAAYCFVPQDVFIFNGSPSDRRDLLDDELCKISLSYNKALLMFDKLNKSKKALLNEENVDENQLDSYNQLLSELSYSISNKRKRLINKIIPHLNDIFKNISKKDLNINLIYISKFKDCESIEDVYKIYNSYKTIEKEAKNTLIGINHDDFILTINDQDISSFGSQGQNRIAAISLKLAMLDLTKEIINKKDLIILDDIFSDLDEIHQERLFNLLKNKGQIFITSVKDLNILKNIQEDINVIEIQEGRIK